jgi:hypothetical protein
VECTAGDGDKIAEGGAAVSRFVKQLLGNPLARIVIAAMGQSAAHLLKRDFHIRRCPFIHISHERTPITNLKNTR